MAKIRYFFSKLNRWQSFIAIMTLIFALVAFIFRYPQHAPEFIKSLVMLGIGQL